MNRIRSVRAKVDLPHQKMGPGFGAYGLRAGGPIVLDPFMNLDDFSMSQPTFPPHPHAGFSAITYMFEDSEGAFINRDSLGDRSRIEPGAFHWTQAASGMMHEEIPEVRGTLCHGLQMFVNLSALHKKAPPRAFHVSAKDVPEVRPSPGVRVRVLAGSFAGTKAAIGELLTLVDFFEVHLDEGAEVELPANHPLTAFALVVKGNGRVGSDNAAVISAHAAVGFEPDGDHLRLVGEKGGMQVLIGIGTPLREPIVFGGPFAMTHQADLLEAQARYQRGEMGRLEPSF